MVKVAATFPLESNRQARIRPASSQNGREKTEKAAKDFESLLLGSWLEQAKQSFATVPGGDEGDDAASDDNPLQSLALQSLATFLTAAGGIGLARSAAKQLNEHP